MDSHKNDELRTVILRALEKIGSKTENDICKYLPGEKGGYLHHFTMRKLKTEEPKKLISWIQEYIIQPVHPKRLEPRQRAPRGSRKKRDVITLTRGDVDRLLDISRRVGDKEMVAKLSPKRSLATLKRDLMKAIRSGDTNHDLWNAYVETLNSTTLQVPQPVNS